MGRWSNGKGGGKANKQGTGGGGGRSEFGHGGGGVNMGSDGVEYCQWTCPVNDCQYRNFGSRDRCRLCQAHPSGRRQPKTGGKGQGARDGSGPTFAQKQLDLAKAEERHQRKKEQLQKELADMRRQRDAALAAAKASATSNEGEDDDMGDEDETEDYADQLAKARRRRKAMQDDWEDDEPEVVRIEAEIARLAKLCDAAKPPRVRLRNLDRKVDRCQKQLDAKTRAVEETLEQIKKLQGTKEEQEAAVATATAALAEAKSERAAELQKALEEEAKPGADSRKPDTQCDSAGRALEVLVAETRARLPEPGGAIAAAIEAAMAQLLGLLAQLPNTPVKPTSAPSAVGTSAASPPPAAADNAAAACSTAAAATAVAAAAPAAATGNDGNDGARSNAAATAAAAGATAEAVDTDDELQPERTIDPSDDEDIEGMQLDRLENETEAERNARVAKLLGDRRRARAEEKARRQRQARGKPEECGASRRVRDAKGKTST